MKVANATRSAGPKTPMRRITGLASAAYANMSPLRRAASVVLALALWELAARLIDNPVFFVSLTDIVARGIELWRSGALQVHIATSLAELAIGLALGIAVGILASIVMASSAVMEDLFDPWVSLIYSMPIIALAPLFVLWFGIGMTSKVAIVFLMSVFPVLINSLVGLKTADKDYIEAARSFGSTPAQIFVKVRFPSAVPYIVSGIRNGRLGISHPVFGADLRHQGALRGRLHPGLRRHRRGRASALDRALGRPLAQRRG
jgi:ABC-type nitrate/sulfonate/bicarbonate transport system permease component